MSRIGNRKIVVPAGVTVEEKDEVITVKGPKGELTTNSCKEISLELNGNELTVKRSSDLYKAMHGTVNANIQNMIKGVTEGFEKKLEIIGVGYRFSNSGNKLVINAGFSHPVELSLPAGISIEVPSNTELTIKGADKAAVGKFAAEVRDVRPPEPYKGKGIRYVGEYVRRKEGKKAAK